LVIQKTRTKMWTTKKKSKEM